MKIKYHFDARLLKEILRERLVIESSKWDYKTVRNYCSILGEGNLTRPVLCKHLSSALINNFEKILLYMLNNMTDFRDYTKHGIREIWMPRFMLRMLHLAMCPKLEPQVRVSDLIHIVFETDESVVFDKYDYTIPKETVGFVPDYAKQFIKKDKDGMPIVTESPSQSEYYESLIQLTLLSKTAFRDCSLEVGNYADMIEYNAVDFLSCTKSERYDVFCETLTVFGNENLTRENLLTNIILGMYVPNLNQLPRDIFNVVTIPLDCEQLREELRLYIESEFRTSVVFSSETVKKGNSDLRNAHKTEDVTMEAETYVKAEKIKNDRKSRKRGKGRSEELADLN